MAPHTAPADAELLQRLRDGETDAYGELFERHHAAARGYAMRMVRNHATADEVTAEAFTKALNAIRNGSGPVDAFRPYLFAAVRTVAIEASRKADRTSAVELEEDTQVDDRDLVLDATNSSLIGRAYAELPERWRSVLWYLEVEDLSVTEVASIVGMKPNAVSALAFRAREALRVAYLNVHLQHVPSGPGCRKVAPRLARYLRGSVPEAERAAIEAHLATCPYCPDLLVQLTDVASVFHSVVGAAILAPLVAGGVLAARGGSHDGAARRSAGVVAAVLVLVALAGAALAVWIATEDDRGPEPRAQAPGSSRPARPDEGSSPTATSAPAGPPVPDASSPTLPGGPGAVGPPADPPSLPGLPGPAGAPSAADPAPDLSVTTAPIGNPGPGSDAYTQIRVRTAEPGPVVVRVRAGGAAVRSVSAHGGCRGERPMICTLVPGAGRDALLVVRTRAPSADTVLTVQADRGGASVRRTVSPGRPHRGDALEPVWVSDDGAQIAAATAALGPSRCPAGSSATSAELVVPSGAEIRWARAYWYGVDGPAGRNVAFWAPGREPVLLRSLHEDRVGGAVQRSVDVAALVDGPGRYRLEARDGTAGTWTLIVGYVVPGSRGRGVTAVYDRLTPLRPGQVTARALAPGSEVGEVGVVVHGAGEAADDVLTVGGIRRADPFDSVTASDRGPVVACGVDLERFEGVADPTVTIASGSEHLAIGLLWRAPGRETGR